MPEDTKYDFWQTLSDTIHRAVNLRIITLVGDAVVKGTLEQLEVAAPASPTAALAAPAAAAAPAEPPAARAAAPAAPGAVLLATGGSLVTDINLVKGDITRIVSEKLLGPEFADLRNAHQDSVKQAQEIVGRNINILVTIAKEIEQQLVNLPEPSKGPVRN